MPNRHLQDTGELESFRAFLPFAILDKYISNPGLDEENNNNQIFSINHFVKNLPSLHPVSEATAFTHSRHKDNLQFENLQNGSGKTHPGQQSWAHFRLVQTYKVRDFRTFAFAEERKLFPESDNYGL